MDKEELKKRTKSFARRCVKLASSLPNTILGRHLQEQLIRVATSVAANYRAACIAQSRASFTAKLSILAEKSDEPLFWLEFILKENLIKKGRIENLIQEASELTAIFISSRMTIQKN